MTNAKSDEKRELKRPVEQLNSMILTKKELLESMFSEISESLLNFQDLSEDDQYNLIELYIRYAVTRDDLSNVMLVSDMSLDLKINIRNDIWILNTFLSHKNKSLQELCKKLWHVEYEIAHIQETRALNQYKTDKYGNVQNLDIKSEISEEDMTDFFMLFKSNGNIFKDFSHFQFEHEQRARENSLQRIIELQDEMQKIYDAKIESSLNKDEMSLEKFKSSINEMQLTINFIKKFYDNKSRKFSTETLNNKSKQIKNWFHDFVKFEKLDTLFNNSQSENKQILASLAQGLRRREYFDIEIAKKIYDSSLLWDEYESCLIILNLLDYPVNDRQIKDLIIKYCDNKSFSKDYFETMTNFPEEYLACLYLDALQEKYSQNTEVLDIKNTKETNVKSM